MLTGRENYSCGGLFGQKEKDRETQRKRKIDKIKGLLKEVIVLYDEEKKVMYGYQTGSDALVVLSGDDKKSEGSPQDESDQKTLEETKKLFSDAINLLVELLKDEQYEDAGLRALDPENYAYEEKILGVKKHPTMLDDLLQHLNKIFKYMEAGNTDNEKNERKVEIKISVLKRMIKAKEFVKTHRKELIKSATDNEFEITKEDYHYLFAMVFAYHCIETAQSFKKDLDNSDVKKICFFRYKNKLQEDSRIREMFEADMKKFIEDRQYLVNISPRTRSPNIFYGLNKLNGLLVEMILKILSEDPEVKNKKEEILKYIYMFSSTEWKKEDVSKTSRLLAFNNDQVKFFENIKEYYNKQHKLGDFKKEKNKTSKQTQQEKELPEFESKEEEREQTKRRDNFYFQFLKRIVVNFSLIGAIKEASDNVPLTTTEKVVKVAKFCLTQ